MVFQAKKKKKSCYSDALCSRRLNDTKLTKPRQAKCQQNTEKQQQQKKQATCDNMISS